MITKEEEVRRGEEARQILEHPLVIEAYESIRSGLLNKFTNSALSQTHEREEIYRLLKTLDIFTDIFKKHIETGKLAFLSKKLPMR